MSKFDNNRLFVMNNPNSPRLSPELAAEIGLNESIILLQIEFLIAIGNNEKDGMKWTYQSVSELQGMFPFWSKMTINRAVHSLEEQGLIIIANHNKYRYDRTRWFALDYDGISQLRSITLCKYQNDTRSYQNDTRSEQNDTTIPETTTETTTDTTASPSGEETQKPTKSKRERSPVPEAVNVFRKNASRYPAKAWYSKIAEAVGDKPDDLSFWGNVVLSYVGLGWNPTNVKNMLEYYKRREIPSTSGNGYNSKNGNGNGHKPREEMPNLKPVHVPTIFEECENAN